MIAVQHLTKHFGAFRAVDDLAFSVERGEILGFLGPNGAGKSTTMRMLTGFLPPTSGTAVIGGADITRDPVAARRQLGYLPENAPVYPDMRVEDYLHFCGRIRGFAERERHQRVEDVLGRCALEDVREQVVATLSKGYKQRVCFAQSILHDPPYLILDEPTDGLDPNQKHEVRAMIRRMAPEKAIILSSHILDEVDALCTRAIVIARGRIVADDTPEGLRSRSSRHGAVGLQVAKADGEVLLRVLSGFPGVKEVHMLDEGDAGTRFRVLPTAPDPALAGAVLAALTAEGVRVLALATEQGRLDEVFRSLTAADFHDAHEPAACDTMKEEHAA